MIPNFQWLVYIEKFLQIKSRAKKGICNVVHFGDVYSIIS